MDHRIEYRPSFALLTVDLDRDEAIRAESGAMVSYSDGIEIETGENHSSRLPNLVTEFCNIVRISY